MVQVQIEPNFERLRLKSCIFVSRWQQANLFLLEKNVNLWRAYSLIELRFIRNQDKYLLAIYGLAGYITS